MAILALTNCGILAGVADLTGYSNEVSLESEVTDLDTTTFGNAGWRTRQAGLYTASAEVKGFYEAGDAAKPDDRLFADLGASALPVSFLPLGATDANAAYFVKGMRGSYGFGAPVGDMLTWTSSLQADSQLVRGQVANAVARTATGTGTSLELGAVGATQRVWAIMHVTALAGTDTPTLTVVVQGDTATNFPSPATVASFTAATTTTSQVVSGAVGASADSWYRLSWTITGTNPSFSFIAAIGIG